MTGTLVRATYRKLLYGAKQLDQDYALRALLVTPPTAFYDHLANRWMKREQDPEKPGGRLHIEQVLKKLNGHAEWYHPEREEAELARNPKLKKGRILQDAVRGHFRSSVLSSGSLDAAFAGLKAVNSVLELKGKIPKKPMYPPKPHGFTVLNTPTAEDASAEMMDPDGSRSLVDMIHHRRCTLLVAHPMMYDFFANSIILISKMESDGAVGVIINKPLTTDDGTPVPVWSVVPDNFHRIFTTHLANSPVMLGGPVASPMSRQQALFVIHATGDVKGATPVAPGIFVGGSLDELCEKLDNNELKPSDMMVMMGYSGWGSNQLQGEIANGSWTVLMREAVDPNAPPLPPPAEDEAPAEKSDATASPEDEATKEARRKILHKALSLAAKPLDPKLVEECKAFVLGPHRECLERVQGDLTDAIKKEADAAKEGVPLKPPRALMGQPLPHPTQSWVETLSSLSPEYESMSRLASLHKKGENADSDDDDDDDDEDEDY